MNKVLGALGGALLIALLAAAGCGGGGGSGGDEVAATSMSKAKYVEKANAVCEKGTKQIEGDFGAFVAVKGSPQNPPKALFVELVDTVVKPDIEGEIEKLRELGAPSGGVQEVEAILEARKKSIALAEADPRAVIDNPKKVFSEASKAASEYGLEACATR